jgi:hypothetical protein
MSTSLRPASKSSRKIEPNASSRLTPWRRHSSVVAPSIALDERMHVLARLGHVAADVEHYLLCVLFHLLLPWLPLGVELAATKRVAPDTLLLFLAFYFVTIGVSSRNRLIFGASIVLGMTASIFFGMTSGGIVLSGTLIGIGYFFLSLVVIAHARERYNRHVIDDEIYWVLK